jgi:hypothetical protein
MLVLIEVVLPITEDAINRGSGGSSSPLFFILAGKLKNSKAKNERKNRRTTD